MNAITPFTRSAKLVKVGNSVGIVLPKEVLARMRVTAGDEVFITEAPGDAITIGARDADFVNAMAAAEAIMRDDRDILAVLAK
ncbi:AbrB/MazE/SpoVT family DNA-binding domain-containing protein [Sphingomonas gilva]|uniref:AbrB/MazE/SpoVT family DNA-binding domain-containing protein n=1 Tax=Sphingomonas gilva TaxID=2305907 RepID=A0A396RRX5_9SPHN|nr:AbrB/MazE/SpoVT family DNA-binding domain-containing protein [Sphingomonas gilva]RHW19149.1 AbrB/MazE/SpoVT family DNA-binding domain-containing protein [Sphingomonas gilva]